MMEVEEHTEAHGEHMEEAEQQDAEVRLLFCCCLLLFAAAHSLLLVMIDLNAT